jgi:hypothetical protein
MDAGTIIGFIVAAVVICVSIYSDKALERKHKKNKENGGS